MIKNDVSLSFKGLNTSRISPQDMKWLTKQPWWNKCSNELIDMSKKYDIEIFSSSQNIGANIPHSISTLEVIAKPLGSKSGIFGTKKGSAHFDIEMYNVFKNADKTIIDTVKRAIADIRFLLFQ